ncbi:hypothetical protein BB560_000655 [Smittium megazygosporum]|uniref:Uncharacterized protein n=1 Tax=Smittium megazygosporum TaxID=133381 RepID=A0A2T9ZJP6_9FUNG|nr:hypothetical protein BB560_000655 [Smittium megazygosporum]
MSGRFATLFRNSKVAAFDPAIKQVYTTPPHLKEKGNWGIKYTLSKKVHTNYVSIEKMDSKERFPVLKNETSRVGTLKSLRENLKGSSGPLTEAQIKKNSQEEYGFIKDNYNLNLKFKTHPSSNITINSNKKSLSDLSANEFQDLLAEARKKREEFKEALSHKTIKPTEVETFMGLKPSSEDSIGASTVRMNRGNNYFVYVPFDDEEFAVEGRILSSTGSKLDVGIQGTIATLPKAILHQNPQEIDRSVRKFYIRDFSYKKGNVLELHLKTEKYNESSHSRGNKRPNSPAFARSPTGQDKLQGVLSELNRTIENS